MTPTWWSIGHKEKYLRGRTTEELDELFRAGAAKVGVDDVPSYPTELEALEALVKQAGPGDVVGLMCHEDRQGVYDWLAGQGFTPDDPETLREKVRVAQAASRVTSRRVSRVVSDEKQALLETLAGAAPPRARDPRGPRPTRRCERPLLPSGWTCAGLVHHLALDVERFWFRAVMAGEKVEAQDIP